MLRIRAVGIVVDKKNNRVLLLRRKSKGRDYLVFPGGGHEGIESLEQTAMREVMEETSINSKVEKLLYKLVDESNEQHFFLCSYTSGEPKLGEGSHESLRNCEENQYEPMWKNIDDIINLPVLPLEIRNWFIVDYKNDFINCPREANILIEERRKV